MLVCKIFAKITKAANCLAFYLLLSIFVGETNSDEFYMYLMGIIF